MSITVLTATYQHLPSLRGDINSRDWGKHKPGWAPTVAVCLLLADRYRDSRGYVDETVGQIADALVLSQGVVRDVLAALDAVGFWVKVSKGNQHRGTRRRPGFEPGASRDIPRSDEGEHRGADPAVLDGEHRGIDDGASRDNDPSIAGLTPEHRGADPATPHSSPHSSPTTSSSRRRRIRNHLDAHTAYDPFLRIDNPAAVARAEYANALAVVEEAEEFGEDPWAALEAAYPTRAPEGEHYDPDWVKEVV